MTNRFEGSVRRKGVSKMPGRGPNYLDVPGSYDQRFESMGYFTYIYRWCVRVISPHVLTIYYLSGTF